MAKENVAKFYEKLAEDTALAEKLNALDKKFSEKNEAPVDGADIREKAAEAIVLLLATEVGLPFTLEELKEYEQDRLKEMNLSEDELEQVAGGLKKNVDGEKRKKRDRDSRNACAYVGVGIGLTKKNGKTAFCIIIGGSDGPVAG